MEEKYYKEKMYELLETVGYNIKLSEEYPMSIEDNIRKQAKLDNLMAFQQTIINIISKCPKENKDED